MKNKSSFNSGNVVLLENSIDAQGFVKKIGMAEDLPLDKAVKVITDIAYDVDYQTDPRNTVAKSGSEEKYGSNSQATVEIAAHLNRLAVTNS